MFQQRRSFLIATGLFFACIAFVCSAGCNLTQVPETPPSDWPEPRVYPDTDSTGHPFMSVRNQTAYPIIVSLSCDRTAADAPATTLTFDFNDAHRDILGLRVRPYGTSAFYTPWTVNCIVTSWRIQEY